MTLHEKRVALAVIVRAPDGAVTISDKMKPFAWITGWLATDLRPGLIRQSLNSLPNLPNDRITIEVLRRNCLQLDGKDAYLAAYPKSGPASARASAP